MQKFNGLLPIRFDPKELEVNLGEGNFIFVGSGTDAWAFDIPSDWITRFLDYCNLFNNNYLFQSKDLHVFGVHGSSGNTESDFCTTIETNRFYPEIMRNSPEIEERVRAMEKIVDLGIDTYVTAEPFDAV